jgi:hypothetical protein
MLFVREGDIKLAFTTMLNKLIYCHKCHKIVFINRQPAQLEAFDENLVKRWLKQITVRDDHFTVELKSGLSIDIEG